MLKAHMDAIEKSLLAISNIPANAGHSLHKGTPREAFIKEFLDHHLGNNLRVGSGEIIDCNSKPSDKRNQIDIVIYRGDYPKLRFGPDIHGFLVESVLATLEVKSCLTKQDVLQATKSAKAIKLLSKSMYDGFRVGYKPPNIFTYIVAYDGPQQMQTVHKWINSAAIECDFQYPEMPPTIEERQKIPCPGIDAIFILGKGFIYFDNFPLGYINNEMRKDHPTLRWAFSNSKDGNLLLLFTLITSAMTGIEGTYLDPVPYLTSNELSELRLGD